ncbi:hypothetical protein JAAARDRAFT_197380 [Jaapia argillacea MUCL 33604]|uniref:Uncharacterized protein n=1 Tax=Jaapia argillacea MUCL 33604 TaxID=933084 RepID=A0A067PT99_9AGAM|nr:hypothetical protein JAAARDRAFT_197380 [Jaapia argillacea MUCL 33604]
MPSVVAAPSVPSLISPPSSPVFAPPSPPPPLLRRQTNIMNDQYALYDLVSHHHHLNQFHGPHSSLYHPHPAFTRQQSHYHHHHHQQPLYPSPNTAYSPPSQQGMFAYYPPHPPQVQFSWHSNSPTPHHSRQIIQTVIRPQPLAQIPQKVWILDCKSCGKFLTNRGMKAVLLLRPSVALYSTDALPINCSAYSDEIDSIRAGASSSSNSSTLGSRSHQRKPPSAAPRTCECLTQTLYCHGCGNSVGYMIVIPCMRCTASTSSSNRSTNGHRFVFHSSEIRGSERHYIPDEPGVYPYHPSAHDQQQQNRDVPSLQAVIVPVVGTLPADHGMTGRRGSRNSNPIVGSLGGQIPTPPPEEGLDRASEPSSPSLSSSSSSDESIPSLVSVDTFSVPSMDVEEIEVPLKEGEVVYWHHLVRNGEIPGVREDPRARLAPPPPSHRRKAVVFGR